MGFFSKVRKRIKKIIPKEVRPFIPYMAAGMIPGAAASGMFSNAIANKFMAGALARGITDDEADLEDIARTGIFAAAPTALGEYGASSLPGAGTFLGEGATKAADYAQAHKFQTLAGQGSADAAIKQVELNEDALARYNADLARQGIDDKAGRRAAIRAIYADTGTWDMDEVDGMLDTYGYRTGGRVGYADAGDVRKDPEEVAKTIGGEYQDRGIGTWWPYSLFEDDRAEWAGEEMVEEMQDYKYGKSYPGETEWRKDKNKNIGGYNSYPKSDRDPMSMEDTIAALEAKWEEDGPSSYFEDMGIWKKKHIRRRIELGWEEARGPVTDIGIMSAAQGGRVGLKNGSKYVGTPIGGITTMTDLVKDTIVNDDSDDDEKALSYGVNFPKRKKKKKKNKDDKFNDTSDDLEMAVKGYNLLYPEVKPASIRPLTFEDGGPVDDRLMERVKELQDEGLDFASAMAQAMKELQSSRKSIGGIMDGVDVNLRETIDTPRGSETIDVNSMEEIKGQTAGPDWYMDRLQHLEFLGYNYETAGEIAYDTDRYYNVIEMNIAPGPGEGDDDYARGGRVRRDAGGLMASMEAGQEGTLEDIFNELIEMGMNPEDAAIKAREIYNDMSSRGSGTGNMASADMDMPIQDLAEEFEITFGRPAESLEELKDYYRRKYEFNGDTSDAGNNGVGKMASTDREWIIDSSRDRFANDMFGKDYDDLTPEQIEEVDIIIEIELGKNESVQEEEVIQAAHGGLMNLGGKEMDLRGGGFVPMGKKERADDVPARLSKNEFVMTADAVRSAGGGNVQKGADLMYDKMKQLEGQA